MISPLNSPTYIQVPLSTAALAKMAEKANSEGRNILEMASEVLESYVRDQSASEAHPEAHDIAKPDRQALIDATKPNEN